MDVKPIQLKETDKLTSCLKEEGLYVITGGLGGIGVHLSQYLLKQYGAELLLLGRTSLTADMDKKQELERLQSIGKVHYLSMDITTPGAMEQAVQKLEQETGKEVHAIFHLAGTMDLGKHYENMTDHLIVNETIAQYQKMFQAKGKGTDAIYELAKKHNHLNVILFSSCNGVFGGNSFSAYSAANSYLDAMADKIQTVTKGRCFSINWSMWEYIGMSESINENMSSISESMGYKLITPEYGIPSMECILQREISHAIIGINGTNQKINQKYRTSFYMQSVQEKKEVTEQLTELEQKVKEVWQTVLGHSKFGKTDKFFEIGGNSIMSIQLAAAMNKISDVKIEVVDLFKYTTIEQLAEYISEMEQEIGEDVDTQDDITGMTF